MKTMTMKMGMLGLVLAAVAVAAVAPAAERQPVSESPLHYGGVAAKAAVDTITVMGPGGLYPFRGDFETASALPGGNGQLPDGWSSIDYTVPANHWHVDDFAGMAVPYAPLSGARSAWAGDRSYPSCGANDPAGGYGNNSRDVLEFRRTVTAAAHTVRVQALLRYDSEPAYDFTTLQRRTAGQPDFEPVAVSGQSWDGAGSATGLGNRRTPDS